VYHTVPPLTEFTFYESKFKNGGFGLHVTSIRIIFSYFEILTGDSKWEMRREVIIGGSSYGVNQFLC